MNTSLSLDLTSQPFADVETTQVVSNDNSAVVLVLTDGTKVLLSPEDADLATESAPRWGAKRWKGSRTVYAQRGLTRAEVGPEGKLKVIRLHRLIAMRMGLQIDGLQVDHINQDGCDNRRCNLRVVTNQQNHRNVAKKASNTSGFVGVSWHKGNEKWQVRLRIDGKMRHLGLFTDIFEAAIAYDRACLANDPIHGVTNFDRRAYAGTYGAS